MRNSSNKKEEKIVTCSSHVLVVESWGWTSPQSRRFLGSERFMKTMSRPFGPNFESRACQRRVNNSSQPSITFTTQDEGMIAESFIKTICAKHLASCPNFYETVETRRGSYDALT